MTGEFRVEVVRVGELRKHENADTLSIIQVYGYPVIVRTGDFAPGDLAVYVMVDALVPLAAPEFAFLARVEGRTVERICAKKLRGVFSMGLLVPAREGWVEGQDVQVELGITKWEPPEEGVHMGGGVEEEPGGGFMPRFTDVQALRRYPDVLQRWEMVEVTEKIHGTNARFAWHDGRLWVGSHRHALRESLPSLWWKVADQYRLAERLAAVPAPLDQCVWFGEVYGAVQKGFDYGLGGGLGLVMFDVFDLAQGRYLDAADRHALLELTGLPGVPVLYEGLWEPGMAFLAEGDTVLGNGCHVREGIVVRPTVERWDDRVGRVILKLHGEAYLLRKGG